MLAYFAKEAPSAPEVLERSLSFPVEWKKTSAVFNFVIMEMRGDPLVIDSRWELERKIALVEKTRVTLGGSGAPIENLREMLSQMGFNLNIPDLSQVNKALTELQETRVNVERGTTDQYRLPSQYSIDNSPHQLMVDGQNYTLDVIPVNAKPNLNYLDQEALERYLIWLGLEKKSAEKLSQVIVDYRDEDGDSMTGNSEGPYQTNPKFTTYVRNDKIRSYEELAYLPGFDAALINFLRAHFTIYGNDGRMNIKYNSNEAIAALTDMRIDTVQQALDYEKNKNDPLNKENLDVKIGTEDAAKWRSLVTDFVADDQPVELKFHGNKTIIDAVYVPKLKKLLDVRIN